MDCFLGIIHKWCGKVFFLINIACLKVVFILWLVLNRRLNTIVRIQKRNPSIDICCNIYNGFFDSQSHGDCNYANELWNILFSFLVNHITFADFEENIDIMTSINKKKTPMAKIIIFCWTEFIYEVCHHPNSKTFDNIKLDSPNMAAKSILFRVLCRTMEEQHSCIR